MEWVILVVLFLTVDWLCVESVRGYAALVFPRRPAPTVAEAQGVMVLGFLLCALACLAGVVVFRVSPDATVLRVAVSALVSGGLVARVVRGPGIGPLRRAASRVRSWLTQPTGGPG